MSALSQKQTCAVQNGMSALPLKADVPTINGEQPACCFCKPTPTDQTADRLTIAPLAICRRSFAVHRVGKSVL
jgi:hypothetical protein